MGSKILELKFESVRRCIERIESKKPFTLKRLQSDYDLQDIISINLERAVQNSVDLATLVISDLETPAPDTMSDAFEILQRSHILKKSTCERMKKSVGFRNLLVHEYSKIDWNIVFAITSKHLIDFKKYLKEINAWHQKQS